MEPWSASRISASAMATVQGDLRKGDPGICVFPEQDIREAGVADEWENVYHSCLKTQVLATALHKHGLAVHIFSPGTLRIEDRRMRSFRSPKHQCGDKHKSKELVPTPILF